MNQFKLTFFLSTLFLVGCVPSLSSNTYQASDVGVVSHVVAARVVSIRKVSIDANTNTGGAAGSLAGATAGATLGNSGATAIIGGIGGAVVGGLVGNGIENSVNKSTGYEYILRLKKNKRLVSLTQQSVKPFPKGTNVLIIYGARTRLIADTK
jgi:outer membrane lipoprotein SlyB